MGPVTIEQPFLRRPPVQIQGPGFCRQAEAAPQDGHEDERPMGGRAHEHGHGGPGRVHPGNALMDDCDSGVELRGDGRDQKLQIDLAADALEAARAGVPADDDAGGSVLVSGGVSIHERSIG